MSVDSDLFDIALLRSTPQYFNAEVARRGQPGGADAMAGAPHDSQLYAEVRVLIATWETIAMRINREGKKSQLRTRFYETNPLWQMWLALKGAIEKIRNAEFKGKAAALFAREFETLATTYKKEWYDKQPPGYQTAADQGINAQFG